MNPRLLTTGIWLATGSPIVTELAAQSGFDWLLLDLEHGCLTESGLLQHLMAAKGSGARPIVRIGKYDPALVARVLDWGAAGIMLPHVTSPGEAQACLSAMYYPPAGNRGYSSSARSFGYGTTPPDNPARQVRPLFLAQIEDHDGLQNAGDIAAVPGVDVLFVGPSDLRLNLKAHFPSIDFQEALSGVARAAVSKGKQAGILVRHAEDLPVLRAAGFSCLALGSDLGVLRQGFRAMAGL